MGKAPSISNMYKSLRIFFSLIALLVSCAWADPQQHSQVRIVRLSFAEGQVQFDRNDGQGFGPAFLNVPVIEGSRLSTGSDGLAEVEFEDDSTARLTPNTVITFQQLRRDGDGATQSLLSVDQGEAYFNVKHKNDDFRVQVGSEIFSAVKDCHFRVASNQGEASLAVFKGDVQLLMADGQKVAVKKHESLSISSADGDRYFLAQNITSDPQDEWDNQRQSYVTTETNNLNQYGSYLNVSNYGTVWRPYGVGYDWNPYGAGSWMSYPGAGSVWVSSYPWGWAPYRYGAWNFIPGIGWAWEPGFGGYNINPYGFSGYGWNTGPVVVSTPQGYLPPSPPRNPTGVVVVGNPPRLPINHPRGGDGVNSYVNSAAQPAAGAPIGTTVTSRPQRLGHATNAPTPTSQPSQVAAGPMASPRTYTPPPQRTYSPPPQRTFSPPPMPASAPSHSGGRNPK
jgi:hypothetical protein